ncbi:hypothetical protein JCM18897A_09040 [Streptomyces sp. JCM 18897]
MARPKAREPITHDTIVCSSTSTSSPPAASQGVRPSPSTGTPPSSVRMPGGYAGPQPCAATLSGDPRPRTSRKDTP